MKISLRKKAKLKGLLMLTASLMMLTCDKIQASFDLSVQSSCVDLSGRNFPSPIFQVKAEKGSVPAGTEFTVTFNKDLKASYIQDWNGKNSFTVERISSDKKSAIIKLRTELSSGQTINIYLNQMMTKGDVASLSLNGSDQKNGNNKGTLKVIQPSPGAANECRTE